MRQKIEHFIRQIGRKSGKREEFTFILEDVLEKLSKQQVFDKNTGSARDEFEHMTNWSRIFESLYTRIKWLKTYNSINQMATLKILKKFMKNYFSIKENHLSKQLREYIQGQPFQNSIELAILT